MRGKLGVLFYFFTYFFFPPPSADYSDSEDAVYLTTMDTPLVCIASARSK